MEWKQGGDMVWWDNRYVLDPDIDKRHAEVHNLNRQSMHRANPYTEAMTARDVRRSTILDDGPLAYGASSQEKIATGWCP